MTDAKRSNSAQIHRNKVLKAERLKQFRTFLEDYVLSGNQIPKNDRNEPNIRLLCRTANLSTYPRDTSELREIAREYGNKVGYCDSKDLRNELKQKFTESKSKEFPKMTYDELLEMDIGVSEKSRNHYISSLKRFIKNAKKSSSEYIGSEFLDNFESNISRLIKNEFDGNKTKARFVVSAIRKWHSIWLKQNMSDGLPKTLQGVIALRMEEKGLKEAEVSLLLGDNRTFINEVLTKNVTNPSIKKIVQLEKILELPQGTLVSRLQENRIRSHPLFCPPAEFPEDMRGTNYTRKRIMVKSFLPLDYPALEEGEKKSLLRKAIERMENEYYPESYRKRQGELYKLSYRINFSSLPKSTQSEIDDLLEMKQRKGGMDKIYPDARWNANSSKLAKSELLRFLGYCTLEKSDSENYSGLSIPKDNLTLGLILSRSVVSSYVKFLTARSGGIVTKNTEGILLLFLSLLKQRKGWLTGHPEITKILPPDYYKEIAEIGEWSDICENQYQFLKDLKANLIFLPSRDPFLPIMPIIDSGRPADYLKLALEAARREIDDLTAASTKIDISLALKWRDYILINLLSKIPFRAKHWTEMTYYARHKSLYYMPNGGSFRKIADGKWMLYLEAKSFKNVRNKDIFGERGDRDIKVFFSENSAFKDVETDIDYYMTTIRPILCSGDGPVFPTVQGTALNRDTLNDLVSKWTRYFLSEKGNQKYGLRVENLLPFGPHAFRHIIASHIVITTGSFEAASYLLLDSLEMIKSHYGRFAPEQRLQLALNSFDTWNKS